MKTTKSNLKRIISKSLNDKSDFSKNQIRKINSLSSKEVLSSSDIQNAISNIDFIMNQISNENPHMTSWNDKEEKMGETIYSSNIESYTFLDNAMTLTLTFSIEYSYDENKFFWEPLTTIMLNNEETGDSEFVYFNDGGSEDHEEFKLFPGGNINNINDIKFYFDKSKNLFEKMSKDYKIAHNEWI